MANNYQYLDSNGLTTLWGIIKNRFGQIDGIFLGGSGTTAGITNKMATIQTFGPASAGAAGSVGLVPAPGSGKQNTFLRGDGEWAAPVGSTYAAGSGLSLSGTTFNHTNSIISGSVGDESIQSPGFGNSFKAINISVDAQGHITAFGQHNVWIPNSVATTTTDGLMSSTDKIKLDSVASSAEVNQNAFSNIKVGSSTVAADSKTDTFTLVGSGSISLSANTSTDTVTITGTDTTYAVATHEKDGLMSAEDKQTLDNIVTTGGEPNQDAFSYIIAGGSTVAADDKKDTLTLVGAGSISLSAATGTDTITITGSTSVATTATNGLMSSTDKIKLDGIGLKTVSIGPEHILAYDPQIGSQLHILNGGRIAIEQDNNNTITFTHAGYIAPSTVGSTTNISGSTVTIPYISYDQYGHISNASTVKYTVGNLAANAITSGTFATARIPNLPASIITSGTFSSAIHASSPGATYSLVNKQYVDSAISSAISGAASFQGTATSTYPAAIENHEAGQYWLVTQDGKYVDGAFECQPGDMIFAIATTGTTADFTVIQQNLSPITTDDINTICV